MCEKSEFLWRERPVLYHVMPFRSSNYTNFSNYIWYGISKKACIPSQTANYRVCKQKKSKYQAHSSKIFDNFSNVMYVCNGWMYTWTTIICLINQSCNILHLISFFFNHPKPYCSAMCIIFFCNRFYKVYTYLLLTYSTASSSWIYVYITLKSMRKYEFLSSFQIYTSMF